MLHILCCEVLLIWVVVWIFSFSSTPHNRWYDLVQMEFFVSTQRFSKKFSRCLWAGTFVTHLSMFSALTHYDGIVAPRDCWNVVIDIQDLDGNWNVTHHTRVICKWTQETDSSCCSTKEMTKWLHCFDIFVERYWTVIKIQQVHFFFTFSMVCCLAFKFLYQRDRSLLEHGSM